MLTFIRHSIFKLLPEIISTIAVVYVYMNLLTFIRHNIFKVPPKIISNIAVVCITMLLKSRNHNSDNNNKIS